jgi:hypothetical protein
MKILITEEQFKTLTGYLMEQKVHPYVSKGLITQKEFDEIKSILNNETRKYFDFLLKAYINGYKDISDMKNIIEEYHVFAVRGKAKYKDVNQYKTFDNLKQDVDMLNQTGSGMSKKEWETDYDVIRDDGDVIIYVPHSHEAARKLSMSKFGWKQCSEGEGLETPYCIAYKTPKHFENYYYKYNITFYLIRAISGEMKDKLEKLAINFGMKNDDFEVFALSVFGEKIDKKNVPIINGYAVEGTTKYNKSILNQDILVKYLNVIGFDDIKPIRDIKERKEKQALKVYNIIEDYIKKGSVGNLDLSELPIKTLGKLKRVGGALNLSSCTYLKNLGNLKTVKKWLDLSNCTSLTSLDNLERVEFLLSLKNCPSLTSLGNLEKVGSTFILDNCPSLISLGNLQEVEVNLSISGCTSLDSLGNLRRVGGSAILRDCTSLTSLGNLKEVGKLLTLEGCASLTNLGKIERVGNSLNLMDCTSLISLGKLERVGGKIFIHNTPLADMYKSGELEKLYPQFKGKFML